MRATPSAPSVRTPTCEIAPFDPIEATTGSWRAYHAFRRARHAEVRPDDPLLSDAHVESLMRRENSYRETLWFVAMRGGDATGAMQAGRARPGTPGYEQNRRYMHASGSVLVDHRRQGIGTEFARRALALMDGWGCDVLTTWSEEDDGHAFLRRLGAEERSRGAENRLDLRGVDWRMVEAWAEEGRRRSPATTMELYEDRIPDEALDEYCPMLSALLNTMPFDEMDHGEIVITPEMAREGFERLAALDGAHHVYVAREPDGRIGGMTDVVYLPSQPDRIEQQFTGVHPDARGRGLGKWLKAAMLLYLRRRYPVARWVVTGNAHSNAPMLAINRRLGFRQAHEGATYQMSRDALAAWLDAP